MPPDASARRVWRLRPVDQPAAERIAQELGLHPMVAQVLAARGVDSVEQARAFVQPRLSQLTPPESMAGMEQAARRLAQAVLERQHVGVFGDYDVDGVSSTALLGDYLRRCGARTTLRVARREEGYGFGTGQARELVQAGCQLLVLLDCGSNEHEAVAEAVDAGLDVVAVDHHTVSRGAWPGQILVNPQQPSCAFPYKGLATAGLAFYLVARLRRQLTAAGHDAPDPRQSLDLVALGTVADVAPLDGDNRILVAQGLRWLGSTERPGLRQLMQLAKARNPTSKDVGWLLGPRLNAPGRMGDAAVSLDCLLQQDQPLAAEAARRCDQINDQRKEIQSSIIEQAQQQAAQQVEQGRAFILAAGRGWHAGVVGIVASRLVDEFHRPCAVAAINGDEARGSARSLPGVDLLALLHGAKDRLLRYGGHRAAAGLRFHPDQLEPLRQQLHELADPALAQLGQRITEVDGMLDLTEVDLGLCKELEQLEPHGHGNPQPRFGARGVRVEHARVVGQRHLRLDLRAGDGLREAIGFGMHQRLPRPGALLDLVFVPEINTYYEPRVQLRLEDLQAADDPCWQD